MNLKSKRTMFTRVMQNNTTVFTLPDFVALFKSKLSVATQKKN
ncbi:hypothetical protein N9R79_09375 [Vibrio sp.]|nr:hypothetical protein [Vibrio sp.]